MEPTSPTNTPPPAVEIGIYIRVEGGATTYTPVDADGARDLIAGMCCFEARLRRHLSPWNARIRQMAEARARLVEAERAG